MTIVKPFNKTERKRFHFRQHELHTATRIRGILEEICKRVGKNILHFGIDVVRTLDSSSPRSARYIINDQTYFVLDTDLELLQQALEHSSALSWGEKKEPYHKADWDVYALYLAPTCTWDDYYCVRVVVLPTAEGFSQESMYAGPYGSPLLMSNAAGLRIALKAGDEETLKGVYSKDAADLNLYGGVNGADLVSLRKYLWSIEANGDMVKALALVQTRMSDDLPGIIEKYGVVVADPTMIRELEHPPLTHVDSHPKRVPITPGVYLVRPNQCISVLQNVDSHPILNKQVKKLVRYQMKTDGEMREVKPVSSHYDVEVSESVILTAYRRFVEAITGGHVTDTKAYDDTSATISLSYDFGENQINDEALEGMHFFRLIKDTGFDVVGVEPAEYEEYLNEPGDVFGMYAEDCLVHFHLYLEPEDDNDEVVGQFKNYIRETSQWMDFKYIEENLCDSLELRISKNEVAKFYNVG